jgi:hypothetical protein
LRENAIEDLTDGAAGKAMMLKIPEVSLVVLIGPRGSDKSAFELRHFRPTEILAADACRGMISDDDNDQTVAGQTFEVLQLVAAKPTLWPLFCLLVASGVDSMLTVLSPHRQFGPCS